jgi:hypothetical protein
MIARALCSQPAFAPVDQFDPDLQSVRSVNAAVAYVKGARSGATPTATATAVDTFVRKRFSHGYSEFTPCQDWIAYLMGFAWSDLRNPVLPDDILQHRRAACSQQSIVFESIARQFGLDVASVRLDGHFLPATRLGGNWTVFDPDREIQPSSYPLSNLLAGDPRIEAFYGSVGRQLGMVRQARAGEVRLVHINSNPAPRASLLHRLTHFFSHYGWAFFLGLFLAKRMIGDLASDSRRWRRVRQVRASALSLRQ